MNETVRGRYAGSGGFLHGERPGTAVHYALNHLIDRNAITFAQMFTRQIVKADETDIPFLRLRQQSAEQLYLAHSLDLGVRGQRIELPRAQP